eukprot:g4367.t1
MMVESPNLCLSDLPSSFLLNLFRQLSSHRDIISLQSSCKSLLALGRSSCVWLDRIEKEYGLRLKVTDDSEEDAPLRLFQENISITTELRFWGVFTDGGCDRDLSAYWMDNVFSPNRWESFCSRLGEDIHCIGVMIDDILERDVRAPEEREYMIERCRLAAFYLYNELGESHFQSIQTWTDRELSKFLFILYEDFQVGGRVGALLLSEVDEEQKIQETNKLRNFVAQQQAHQLVNSFGILKFYPTVYGYTTDDESSLLSYIRPDSKLTPRPYYYDKNFTEIYNSRDKQTTVVGVIESVTLSRQGSFSCPVSSGVLFCVEFGGQKSDSVHEDFVNNFVQISMSRFSEQFKNLANIESVLEASEKGILSCEILSQGKSSTGQWIEFNASKQHLMSTNSVLIKPVLWFHFYSQKEIENQHHEGLVPDEAGDNESEIQLSADNYSITSEHEVFHIEGVAEQAEQADEVISVDYDDADENPYMMLGMDIASSIDGSSVANDDNSGQEENQLTIPLTKRVGGNCVLLKLLNQENLMSASEPDYLAPNIDINAVILKGKKIILPKGIHFSQ